MVFSFPAFRVFWVLAVLALLSMFSGCGSDAGPTAPGPAPGGMEVEPTASPAPSGLTPAASPRPVVSPAVTLVGDPPETGATGATVVAFSATAVPPPTGGPLSPGASPTTAVSEGTPPFSTLAPPPTFSSSDRPPPLEESSRVYSADDGGAGVRSAESSVGSSSESGGRGGRGRHPDPPDWPGRHGGQVQALTAREVDDNLLWDEYLRYLDQDVFFEISEVDVSVRHEIRVTDDDGRPLANARVVVSADGEEIWDGVTYADGGTYFYPLSVVPAGWGRWFV